MSDVNSAFGDGNFNSTSTGPSTGSSTGSLSGSLSGSSINVSTDSSTFGTIIPKPKETVERLTGFSNFGKKSFKIEFNLSF